MVALSVLANQLIGQQPSSAKAVYTIDPAAIQASTGPFNILVGSNPTINSPNSAWNDITFSWGWNSDTAGNPVAAGKPVLTYNLETGFWNGTLGSESHHVFTDTTGESHRLFSYFLPWNGSATYNGLTYKIDRVDWQGFGTQSTHNSTLMTFDWSGATPTVYMRQSAYHNYQVNNTFVATQMNAAGNAALYLPYINSSDVLVVSQSTSISGTVPSGSGNALLSLAATIAANQEMIKGSWSAVTGDLTGLDLSGSVTGTLKNSLRNSAGSGNGNVSLKINVANAGSGDPMIGLRVEAGTGWIVGVDNSDSDKFKIGIGDPDNGGALLGSNDKLTIDASGNVGLATASPTGILDVNDDHIRVRTAKTPATAGAAGNAGDVCWDSGFVYVCVATNTWKRAAIATW